jgi:FtsH-binding integral membrane protein
MMWREVDPNDQYLLKIIKLIPVEISAAYLAINNLLGVYVADFGLLIICWLILLVTCYFLIKWQTNNSRQALLTCVAFCIWAANISGYFYASERERAILTTILIVSSIFLPKLLAGPPDKPKATE